MPLQLRLQPMWAFHGLWSNRGDDFPTTAMGHVIAVFTFYARLTETESLVVGCEPEWAWHMRVLLVVKTMAKKLHKLYKVSWDM